MNIIIQFKFIWLLGFIAIIGLKLLKSKNSQWSTILIYSLIPKTNTTRHSFANLFRIINFDLNLFRQLFANKFCHLFYNAKFCKVLIPYGIHNCSGDRDTASQDNLWTKINKYFHTKMDWVSSDFEIDIYQYFIVVFSFHD